MNRKQRIALVVGAVVIALLGLFPTWAEYAELDSQLTYFDGDNLGRAWAFAPPASRASLPEPLGHVRVQVEVDWGKQARECFFALLATLVAVAALGAKRAPPVGRDPR